MINTPETDFSTWEEMLSDRPGSWPFFRCLVEAAAASSFPSSLVSEATGLLGRFSGPANNASEVSLNLCAKVSCCSFCYKKRDTMCEFLIKRVIHCKIKTERRQFYCECPAIAELMLHACMS